MSKALPWVRFFPSDWLAGTRGLSPRATALYITTIALMYEKDGPIRADLDWLSRYCSMGRKQTADALATLVDKGKLKVLDDGRVSNERAEREIEIRNKASDSQRKRSQSGWATKRSKNNEPAIPEHIAGNAPSKPTRYQNQTQKESTNVDSNEVNPDGFTFDQNDAHSGDADETKKSAAEAKKIAAEFVRWYGRYPHKVGKARAERAFRQARKKTSFADLCAGLDRYIRDKPKDRHWQNPATWLSGESWLDEPAEVSSAPPRATGPPRSKARFDSFDAELYPEGPPTDAKQDTLDLEPDPASGSYGVPRRKQG